LAAYAVSASAQVETRRATITGGGGDEGKCTIEVRVDIAADVEISGDMGRIRTLGGPAASWVRFQCSSALPRNPSDFRFKGIDGRGNVSLVRDPQSNRGIAVVHIEDPKGGSEGYTFDLEWRGGSDYTNRGGGRLGRDDRDDRDDRGGSGRGPFGRDRDRDRANIVTCASNDNRRSFCEADTRGGVTLLRQHGDRQCREGSTWGYDRRGIWVDRGCRADFEIRR
jgi:hypothetical protein